MGRVIFACMVLMALPLSAQSAPTTQPSLQERVEHVAAALPWLVPYDAFMDREAWGPNRAEVYRLVTSLEGNWTPEDVRPLLRHPDPRIRTLAIVLLFAQKRLDVLPDIARMTGDNARTFSEPEMVSNEPEAKDWPMEPKTVADCAKAAIEVYVKSSDELHELEESQKLAVEKPAELAEQMAKFAARRDVRLSTAGLRVAMARASGQIQALPPERLPKVREVLSRVHDIPEPRQFFVALALDYDRYQLGDDYETGERYLFQTAQQLPREVRLAAVKGERPVDDPDLEPGFGYEYLLDHAVDLFRESDADLLLTVKPQVPPGAVPKGPDPRYVVAAAGLRPSQAEAILEAGLTLRFNADYQSDQRSTLATALALSDSERGLTRAIDWLFSEQGGGSGLCRERFLRDVHERSPSRYRQLVARVVSDKRLTTLGPRSTLILLTTVEGYLGRRLASDDDERSCPAGEFGPAARREDFKPLARWQRVLSETVDEWYQ